MAQQIQQNTFAEACYDSNSIAELKAALTGPADETDMKQWNISAEEWRNSIELALSALEADAE